MKLKIKKDKEQIQTWPQTGHHIINQYNNEKLLSTSHIIL